MLLDVTPEHSMRDGRSDDSLTLRCWGELTIKLVVIASPQSPSNGLESNLVLDGNGHPWASAKLLHALGSFLACEASQDYQQGWRCFRWLGCRAEEDSTHVCRNVDSLGSWLRVAWLDLVCLVQNPHTLLRVELRRLLDREPPGTGLPFFASPRVYAPCMVDARASTRGFSIQRHQQHIAVSPLWSLAQRCMGSLGGLTVALRDPLRQGRVDNMHYEALVCRVLLMIHITQWFRTWDRKNQDNSALPIAHRVEVCGFFPRAMSWVVEKE
eukprot:5337338-Amphidinium_carterae.1